MSGEDVQADLTVALELAKRADAITLARFGALAEKFGWVPEIVYRLFPALAASYRMSALAAV